MNNESHNWEDLFEQLPLDTSAPPEHQADLRAQVLQTFESNAARPSTAQRLKEIGHILMKYKVPHWTAAAVLIVGFAWITFSGGTPALALDDVIDNFTRARTARFDMTVTVTGQPEQTMKAFYLEPCHLRQEFSLGIINISDWAAGKMVSLNTKGKQATVMNIVNLPGHLDSQAQMNQFEWTREQLLKAVDDPDTEIELLGEKKLDGRKMMGFRFNIPSQPMTIWADPDSKFPVQIESTMVGPPQTHVVMSNYEFNVELDESMFSTEIPEGFKITELDVDASKPSETDFLEALRIGSEGSDGQFPAGFDAVAISGYVAKVLARQDFEEKKKPSNSQVQQVIKISRGMQFAVTLPPEADAHYAGAKSKYGAKDQPIFWYKPDMSQTYRVIYGDLSVKESSQAPEVHGARRLSR